LLDTQPQIRKEATQMPDKPNIHLIHGTDDGSVAEAALKLFNALKPADGDDFANDVIDGNADNAEHAHQICQETIQALLTLPFFGGSKVVWLKRATFMGTDRTGEAARAKEGVEALLETLENGVGDDLQFIISASAIHKSRRFFKYLKANANLVEHNKIDTSRDGWEEEVSILVEKKAKPLGLEFEPDALELFVALAGQQLARGESAIGIIRASLIPTIRNLFMAKAVQEMFPNQKLDRFNISKVLGTIPSSDTQWLPQKKAGGVNTWGLSQALGPASAYPMSALRKALEAALQADTNLVTTGLDHRMILHRLIVELVSSSTRKQRRVG